MADSRFFAASSAALLLAGCLAVPTTRMPDLEVQLDAVCLRDDSDAWDSYVLAVRNDAEAPVLITAVRLTTQSGGLAEPRPPELPRRGPGYVAMPDPVSIAMMIAFAAIAESGKPSFRHEMDRRTKMPVAIRDGGADAIRVVFRHEDAPAALEIDYYLERAGDRMMRVEVPRPLAARLAAEAAAGARRGLSASPSSP